MDAKRLKALRKELEAFVSSFAPCIRTEPSRGHFRTYVEGQVSDRERCREAGIPDSVAFRPKWRIALDLLHVAFSRCHIEQLFEESKGEVGLDHFEMRKYLAIRRHLVLSMVSLLFLEEQTERLRGEKSVVEPCASARDCGVPTRP
ncbi:MAG: transposase [Planctomycetes bacterium]|nr:transposase [Planctomycetota bacterium]